MGSKEPKRDGINTPGAQPEWGMGNGAGQWREARSFLVTFLFLLVNLMPGCDNNWLDNSILCSSFLAAQFSLLAAEKKRNER